MLTFRALGLWRSGTTNRSQAAQLPIELLQTIFLLTAELLASETTTTSSRPEWIPMTQVCRQWRAAALGLRELWSSITPGLSISWAQAMLERSAPLPVHVSIRISTATGSDGLHPLAASELLFAASRLRTLRLAGLRADVTRVLGRLRSPSPLEALDLAVVDGGSSLDLPAALFGGRAPHLRRLIVAVDTHIRAPGWLLAGLAEFTTSADVALAGLLGALRGMPQLEVLRVQHCRAAWDDEDAQGVRVALPHLRLVAFRDTTPRRFALLCAHVDAPPTVRRHLFWRLWTVAGWERWEQLLETMHGFVPRESAPGADDGGLQVVRVAGGPARGSFCAWTRSAVAPATSTSQDDALFQVDVDWKESPAEPSGVLGRASPFFHLAGLCGHLRTTHVDGLLIDPDVDGHVDCADATATYWASLASVLPSVRAVWLHKGAPSVLRAVTPGSLLPNLQKLFIVRTTIRSPIEVSEGLLWNFRSRLGPRESPEPGVRDAMGVMGEDLFAFVRNRDGIEVILVGCDVDAGFLDMLRKHAQVDVGEEWVYV